MLCARHLLGLPRLLVFDHGIEHRQELAPAGRPRDLRHFASATQALIQPLEYGVVPNCDPRTHG